MALTHLLCEKAIEALRETAVFCGIISHRGKLCISSLVDVQMAAMSKQMNVSERHGRAALDSLEGLTLWGECSLHSRGNDYRALLLTAQFSPPDHLNRSKIVFEISRLVQETEPKTLDAVIKTIADFEIRFFPDGGVGLFRFACRAKTHADTIADKILDRTLPCWKEALCPDLSSWSDQEQRLTDLFTPNNVIISSTD